MSHTVEFVLRHGYALLFLRVFAGQAALPLPSIPLLLGAWIAWKFIQRRRFLRKLYMARITAGELSGMLDAGQPVMFLDVRLRGGLFPAT